MSTYQIRIGGKVAKLITPPGERIPTSGIIEGDDERHYFFLPSYLKNPRLFSTLAVGFSVQFDPRRHPRGMRARNISVSAVTRVSAHG
jgi:cold shock CspA family protein